MTSHSHGHGTMRAMRPFLALGAGLLVLACGPAPEGAPENGDAAEPEATAPAEEASAETEAAEAGPDAAALQKRAAAIFAPLPEKAPREGDPITEEQIVLGRMLYYEPRLSLSNEISCNSCHDLADYGDDGKPVSEGHEGQRGERNSPTVYNAAFHIAQFWDGRAADVEEQAKGPILNPIEMGMPDPEYVLKVLHAIPGYADLFAAAFPETEGDPITYDNLGRAIGAFERKLVTPAPFDAFLEGDPGALSDAELEGLAVFMDTGCITCHNGVTVGGQMFQKLGVVKEYPTEDPGRAKVTGNEADRHVFKVPSLRNVTETGPWFHDGSIEDLGEAVRLMAEYQLGIQLADEDVEAILFFLDGLTGEIPEDYIAEPELPESGPDTPEPEAAAS